MTRSFLLLTTLALLAGCASSRTPERSTVGEAVVQPFTDLNLRRNPIPPPLVAAAAAPYALPAAAGCDGLAGEIAALDAVLGPDVDAPGAQQDSRAAMAAEFAVDALRDATTGWIPVRGVVRRVTGAEQRARRVRHAVLAGAVRRGYLRGLAEARGCPPHHVEGPDSAS